MSDSQTPDLTNVSVPDVGDVPVENVPDNEVPVVSEVVEEAAEEPVVSEVVEEAAEEPVVSEVVEEPVTITLVPVVSSPEPSAPVEQVVSNIREILTDVPVPAVRTETLEESSDSSELTDDLKQRIAELDYLRECCSSWVGTRRVGKSNFLTAWSNRSVIVDPSVDYENVLVQLEKMPEIVKLWAKRKVNTDSNHFKNIESYTLEKPLFNEKNVEGKVKVLEQLVTLLTDCAKFWDLNFKDLKQIY